MSARALFLLLPVLAAAGCNGPGPLRLLEAQVPDGPPVTLRAGVGDVVFTPPSGYPLGGFGGGERREEWPFYFGLGWPGRLSLWAHQRAHEEPEDDRSDMLVPAEGVHDELTARALVLLPAGGPPVAIVRLDALGVTREMHDLVVEGLEDLGYRRDTVLLCATHTHSGVGAYMRAPLARLAGMDNFRAEIEARLVSACITAVRDAHASARPARLGAGRALDQGRDGAPALARNRSGGPDEAIDPEVLLLRVDDAATRRPLAVVVNYGIHGTVLGQKNRLYTGDVADGIEDAIAARVPGAAVLFLNGAEGDVAPARPEGTSGFGRCDALGRLMADLVVPELQRIETSGEVRVASAVGDLEMGDPYTLLTLNGRERFIDERDDVGSWLGELLVSPINGLLWGLGLTDLHVRLTWSLALGMVVDLEGYVDRTDTRVGVIRLLAGGEDIVLFGVPGEPTHDVGLQLKKLAADRGATRAFVVGLALDHIGYICSEELYRAGGYEARLTLFGPRTADHLLGAYAEALSAAGSSVLRGVGSVEGSLPRLGGEALPRVEDDED